MLDAFIYTLTHPIMHQHTIAYSTNRTLKLTKSSFPRQLLLKKQESRNKVSLIAFVVLAVAVLMPKDALSAPASSKDVKDDLNLIQQVTNGSTLSDFCNLNKYLCVLLVII